MTDGLDYITVRIYRKDEKGKPLIKGSGLLFEDRGTYYVLTAYHCIEDEDVATGDLIPKNLDLTEICVVDDEDVIPVKIIQEFEQSPEHDWYLMEVKKPNINWSYEGKVRFVNKIQVGPVYESYPYVEEYEGNGRYTELTACNKNGFWHIAGSISNGRCSVDSLMKGGSGSGIMQYYDDAFCCFGILKKALPEGAHNDLRSVRINEITPLFSNQVKLQLTDKDVENINKQSVQSSIQKVEEQIQSSTQEELDKILKHILKEVIPSLLNTFQAEMTKGILDAIQQKAECGDAETQSLYWFNKAHYASVTNDINTAHSLYHKAYQLTPESVECIEHEIRYLFYKKNVNDAVELSHQLPENHHLRIAVRVVCSEDMKAAYIALDDEQQASILLRYNIIALSEQLGKDHRWVCYEKDPRIPESLTEHNLHEWLYALSCYRNQLGEIIYLTDELIAEKKDILIKAFEVADKFMFQADQTCIHNQLTTLEVYFCYWGYLLHRKEHLAQRLQNIKIEKESPLRFLHVLMQSSILSLQGKYSDSYNLIKRANFSPSDVLFHLMVSLTGAAKNSEYLLDFLGSECMKVYSVPSSEAGHLANLSGLLSPDSFKEVLDVCRFSDSNDKRYLNDIAAMQKGENIDLSNYSETIDQLSDDSVAFVAQMLFHNGQKELAYKALRSRKEKPSGAFCKQIYDMLIEQDPQRRSEHFETLKSLYLNDTRMTDLQLRQLHNYAVSLTDYELAYSVAKVLWDKHSEDEITLTSLLISLSKIHPEQIQDWLTAVEHQEFTDIRNIENTYTILATSGYLLDAMEFLYQHTLRLNDDELNAFYFDQTLRGFVESIANHCDDVVTEDSYVLYENADGERICKKPSPTSALGKALLDRKVGDQVQVQLTGESLNLKIIRIGNKYNYLHYCIIHDIQESGGNRYFTPFRIDLDQSPNGIVKQFEEIISQMSGDQESPEEQERRLTQEYMNGEICLLQMIPEYDLLGYYYKYLFSEFKVKIAPMNLQKTNLSPLLSQSPDYVLDFSSLILLYEFALKEDMHYSRKFLLPSFIRQVVDTYYKHHQVISSLPLYQTIQNGNLKRLDEHIWVDIDMRLKGLLQWIDDNCKIVCSPDNLNIPHPKNGSVIYEIIRHTGVECIPRPNEMRVLLCDDNYPFLFFHGTLPTATAEMYIYEVEGVEAGERFSRFLCRSHCIGACVPYKYIVEQYALYEAGKDNQFDEIIESFTTNYDINNAIISCRFLLVSHKDTQLCLASIRRVLRSAFSSVPIEFFTEDAWDMLLKDEGSIPATGRVMIQLLNEIKDLKLKMLNS